MFQSFRRHAAIANRSSRKQAGKKRSGTPRSNSYPLEPPIALEPRLMLAGDAGVAVDAAIHGEPASTTGSITDGGDSAGTTVDFVARQVVFIDSRVEDVSLIEEAVSADADVVLLSADEDGLAQITDALSQRRDVSSVHIISHGDDGRIEIGNRIVDRDALRQNAASVRRWAMSLTEDSDILLYGCNVASGDEGNRLVATLAELTAADVAASNDVTGNRQRGGDWVMETQVGDIETSVVLSKEFQTRYAAVLPITVFAAGHTGSESMQLQIDGNTVAEWSNIGGDVQNNEFAAYQYENDSPVSADRIRVVFNNDLYLPGQLDRNLVVDRLVVDGVEYQTESDSVFSTGTWREGVGIEPGNPQSEWLHANGYFQYSESARSADHFVTIYAAGHTGTETMQLSINGEVVQEWQNTGGDVASRDFGTFVYASETAVDANQVRVHLLDGSVTDQFDKNLIVDKIMIDGTAYETEASDVLSTGTWKSEDGIVTGYRGDEWLHAVGYFQFAATTRTYDGANNHLQHLDWGANDSQLLRMADARYADGVSTPVSDGLPGAREISNAVVSQAADSYGNPEAMSALVHVWGQFIDHDMDLTEPPEHGGEAMPIEVPLGDPFFDPAGTGNATIGMTRSQTVPGTGTDTSNPLQHPNMISAYIDGSMIYGSSVEQARSLREFSGGRMRVSGDDLLPVDEDGGFLAGDIRAMENVSLTAMHTLFVREHNYWAGLLQANAPELIDEELYQRAREIVIAEVQSITFNEFLPALLGGDFIDAYTGYRPEVNPGIATEFSTAAYRVGHTMINDSLEFMDTYSNPVHDEITLAEAFFNPSVLQQYGIDSSLKFVASTQTQTIDNQIVDSLRNFLFGAPGSGGFDLASLNINRGRDHGLADYNSTREAYGLARVDDFADITSNVELQNTLRNLYGSVDQIDLWVGGLAEDAGENRSIGETFTTIIADQFTRTRDGDRLWYENSLPEDVINVVHATSLSDIISRNTGLHALQEDVFHMWGVVRGQVVVDGGSLSPAILSDLDVELYNGGGQLVATSSLASDGSYEFTQITKTGAYRVQVRYHGGTALSGGTYQDVWFFEGNQVLEEVDFQLVSSLV
ncbi:peroxidase family protein [Rhodopirellula sallentina]|nr:peroxidase family protein [Rhodopirellula sallentina]